MNDGAPMAVLLALIAAYGFAVGVLVGWLFL